MNKWNNKGFIIELIAFIAIGFICLIFFAAWYYGTNSVNTILTDVSLDSESVNLTDAAGQTFSYYNKGVGYLGGVGYMILFGYMIAILITAYYSQKSPIWFFVFILITMLLYILSVYISNSYETMLSDEILGSTLSGYTAGTTIMLNLPLIVVGLGVIGSVLSIASIYISKNFGGGI